LGEKYDLALTTGIIATDSEASFIAGAFASIFKIRFCAFISTTFAFLIFARGFVGTIFVQI